MAPGKMRDITIQEIECAQKRIKDVVIRSPLIPLHSDWPGGKIYLKLENLQPTGSFKVRGASNAISLFDSEKDVYTASAGNFAQGLAWNCSKYDINCSVLVPEHTPSVKVAAIERYGGRVTRVSYDTWWNVIMRHSHHGMVGKFVHPVLQPEVIAGNGTIGLEILEQLPEVDTVIVPYGGGGLITGIASAIKSRKPDIKVYAAEVETAAPLSAALQAGKPTPVDYKSSFVDCIGSKCVLEDIWPSVKKLVSGSLVVSLQEITDSIRLLAERNHLIVEGGAAAPVAASLNGSAGKGNIVCVISGGNIDSDTFSCILNGSIPN